MIQQLLFGCKNLVCNICAGCLLVAAGIFFVTPANALEEYGAENASTRILVATENTSFKKLVVQELVSQLEDEYYVRLVDHRRGELETEEAADYSAVVIINSGVNSRVRPWVSEWMQESEVKDNIILLTTYRDKGWEPKYPTGVDSITSPSQRNRAEQVAEDIVVRISDITAP